MRISQTTLREYLQLYQSGGLAALKEVNFNQPKSDLDDHQDQLRQEFEKKPPASLMEAARIEELTGLQHSQPQMAAFLTRLGLKRRKVGQIPKRDCTTTKNGPRYCHPILAGR